MQTLRENQNLRVKLKSKNPKAIPLAKSASCRPRDSGSSSFNSTSAPALQAEHPQHPQPTPLTAARRGTSARSQGRRASDAAANAGSCLNDLMAPWPFKENWAGNVCCFIFKVGLGVGVLLKLPSRELLFASKLLQFTDTAAH